MKHFLLFLLLFAGTAFAQTWQTIPMSAFSNDPFLYWDNGQWPFTLRHQHFKINSYDQSIWAVSDEKIIKLDNQGVFQLWNESNCYFADPIQVYTALEFAQQNAFVSSYFTGLYKYDGTNWTTVSNLDKIISLSNDTDTLFAARVSAQFLNIFNGITTLGPNQGSKRIKSRNGKKIGCSDARYGAINDMGVNGSGSYYYIVGTDPYYLDYKNFDFKFTPLGDTLFTSGDRGFSVAVNGVFVDTLTKYNTINMPDLAVLEFEFDAYNNIWALLGTSTPDPPAAQKLAYLNRATNTWSMIYDEFNSPLDFPRVTIELDSSGNVWVANKANLHVLKMGNVPQWLGDPKLQKDSYSFLAVPNPSNGTFEIISDHKIKSVNAFDASGRMVYSESKKYGNNTIRLTLESGIYQIQIIDESGRMAYEKIVVY